MCGLGAALGRRRLVDPIAAALVALAVYAFFGHAFLNYDSFYSLVWGADLAAGRRPGYDVPIGPTPHPLAIAAGALASPLGDAAETALLALVVLAIGAICVGLYRLGAELYAWPVGLLAAGIALTRVPPLNFGIRGYVDLPMVAFIVWAAVLEARRPRRGAPVLVLLGLAGLLRPEAWGFAIAYWAWLAPALGRAARLRTAALALAAPALWAVADLAVTGDPLFSLTETRGNAALLERRTGPVALIEILPRRLGEIMRLPELVASVLGLAAGLVWFRRRTLVPAAVAVLNGLAFTAFALAELPLLGRYLIAAAAMLALLAALAALGWTALPEEHPARRRWRVGGLALLLAFAAFFPVQAGRLGDLRADIARRDRIQADLHDLVRRPAAEEALASCGTLYVPNHRNVPNLVYWTGLRPERVVSAQLERPLAIGMFLQAATPEVERLSVLDPKDPARFSARPPAGYRPVARNRSWVLRAACPALRRGG